MNPSSNSSSEINAIDAADPYWDPLGIIRKSVADYIEGEIPSPDCLAELQKLVEADGHSDDRCRNAARLLLGLAKNPRQTPTEPMARDLFVRRERRTLEKIINASGRCDRPHTRRIVH